MKILGAITGDVIGSCYEHERNRIKRTDFPLFSPQSHFTDDSVLTVATMECLMSDDKDYAHFYQKYALKYPNSGFGGFFRNKWMYAGKPLPYNSFGNGSAMRVSPAGWIFSSLDETLAEAENSAAVTHNHPEGIKGAQAVASAIFLARTGATKADIRQYVATTFGYDLNRTCDEIRPAYKFNSSCQGSVPEAIIAFLDSSDFETAVRLAISLGGDSDTLAAMSGSVAEAFYGGVPDHLAKKIMNRLPEDFVTVIEKFEDFINDIHNYSYLCAGKILLTDGI
jgi:ADP-ribosylglycohydrolase